MDGTGAMRLAALVVMALYFLLMFASIRSDAAPKKTFLFPKDGNKKENKSSNVPIEEVYRYFSNKEKNTNNTLDEKRMVPTGPNPLHNR